MEYQELGATGMKVSPICLGTWQMGGGWGHYDEAIAAVGSAFDLGINFFDTAYAYGWGEAEKALAAGLGDLLHSHRGELVIASKGGLQLPPGSRPSPAWLYRNSDADYLRATLEQSLRALCVEYLDIFFIHWPDLTVPFAETGSVLRGFVEEGLVRHAGVSNFDVAQMEDFEAGGPIGVAQIPYNLLDQRAENQVLPYCADHTIGLMGYSGLAHGVLTGAFRHGSKLPNDWRARDPAFGGERFEAVLDVVESLIEIATEHGCSLAQLSLAWILHGGHELVPIIGAQEPAHIEDSVQAVNVRLTEAEMAEIGKLVGQVSFILDEDDTKALRFRRAT